MGGSFADKVLGIAPPKPVRLPPAMMPSPTAMPSRGDMYSSYRRKGGGGGGRGETILTGDLIPLDIGKRSLLGGTG